MMIIFSDQIEFFIIILKYTFFSTLGASKPRKTQKAKGLCPWPIQDIVWEWISIYEDSKVYPAVPDNLRIPNCSCRASLLLSSVWCDDAMAQTSLLLSYVPLLSCGGLLSWWAMWVRRELIKKGKWQELLKDRKVIFWQNRNSKFQVIYIHSTTENTIISYFKSRRREEGMQVKT